MASPFKSASRSAPAIEPATGKLAGGPKPPAPSPSSTANCVVLRSVPIRSGAPSPETSAACTEFGPKPTAIAVREPKPPPSSPGNTETVEASWLVTTRSVWPSPSKSAESSGQRPIAPRIRLAGRSWRSKPPAWSLINTVTTLEVAAASATSGQVSASRSATWSEIGLLPDENFCCDGKPPAPSP